MSLSEPSPLKQALLVAAAALLGTGCVTQGLFAERGPMSRYLGDAPMPERVRTAEGWALKAALHTHTRWSHGALSAEELVRVARSNGVAVLAVTEHDLLEACYTRLFCFRDPSVVEMGYASYFSRMAELQQASPDVVLLPALEVTPHAYWRGFPPWLRLHGWNRHFTVYDLDDPASWATMPTLGNQDRPRSYFQGDRGDETYARFTRHVAEHGGMTFLAHPESRNSHHFLTARTDDDPYPEFAAELPGVTGFAAFPAGHGELLEAGGIWDQVLMEYLRGERDLPVWAIGDADFHGDEQSIDRTVTWIHAEAPTQEAVLGAMRGGRMATFQGPDTRALWVTEFSLRPPGSGAGAVMLGQTTRDPAAVEIRFGLSRDVPGLELRLIRNGEVIATGAGRELRFDDSAFLERGGPAYYRVEGTGDGGFLLATNPIFRRTGRLAAAGQQLRFPH
jgi:hypothetical protein